MQEAVAKLGGEVNTKGYFEPSTTHIITAKVVVNASMSDSLAACLFPCLYVYQFVFLSVALSKPVSVSVSLLICLSLLNLI